MLYPLLFADVPVGGEPCWTNKEVLAAFGAAGFALIPTVWGLVRLLTGQYRERAHAAEDRANGFGQRVRELESLADAGATAQFDELTQQLGTERMMRSAADMQVGHLSAQVAGLEAQTAGLRQTADGLTAERTAVAAERDAAAAALAAERKRILKAADRDGLTWTDKVLQSQFIPFKPLEPDGRRTPVLSVLNLKGGVGKTTAAAHLGAALSDLGYRVLLIDLDLQGSLTEYYTTTEQLSEAYQGRRLLADFLERSFDADFPNLNDYTLPVLPGSKSALVPTTDVMAYAELNLTVRWFLRDTNRDPRFLLRRELHLKRVTDRYDLVLIDCPPLMNTCCVNALVASDYVLAPVLPSKQVTDRANILFKMVKELRVNLNPHLRLMGFFANRTERAGGLTDDERTRMAAVARNCKDVLDKADAAFDAHIPRSVAIREAEDTEQRLRPEDAAHAAFRRLADEVVSRLPTFCRPAARTALAAQGVTA